MKGGKGSKGSKGGKGSKEGEPGGRGQRCVLDPLHLSLARRLGEPEGRQGGAREARGARGARGTRGARARGGGLGMHTFLYVGAGRGRRYI